MKLLLQLQYFSRNTLCNERLDWFLLDNDLLGPGAVSVDSSLSLDDHAVILELGISKPRLGDSASGDSVVDEDQGVKLVHAPKLEIRTVTGLTC